MNVKVEPDDLRKAATKAMLIPGLIAQAKNLAKKTAGAEVGTVHIGGPAEALYATAYKMNNAIIRNHQEIVAGLIEAADSYQGTDEDAREKLDRTFRLDEEEVLRKMENQR